MRISACKPAVALCCITANSSLTIGVKFGILKNKLSMCGFESEMLRNPAHIAKQQALRQPS